MLSMILLTTGCDSQDMAPNNGTASVSMNNDGGESGEKDTGLLDESLYVFNADDIEFLESFHIDQLTSAILLQKSPFPQFSQKAEKLGEALFFDTALSDNNTISCASCHNPDQYFTDGKTVGEGLDRLHRNTPTVVGASFSPWQYWDGRKDSLWSQALAPIEHPMEMGSDRVGVVKRFLVKYSSDYFSIVERMDVDDELIQLDLVASPIGSPEDRHRWDLIDESMRQRINLHFSNIGKMIMAYEQKLIPEQSRFDQFVALLKMQSDLKALKSVYSFDEVMGLRLFMGKANCAGCHNGPLFTNYEFHNIGVPEYDQKSVDLGRFVGAKSLALDEFNCTSEYSLTSHHHITLNHSEEPFEEGISEPQGNAQNGDAGENLKTCPEIAYLKTTGKELIGAFKTPSLRNIELTAPYMQSGQIGTLLNVVKHYNKPKPPFFDPVQHPEKPHFDIFPLGLTEQEEHHLVSFLKTLTDISRSN